MAITKESVKEKKEETKIENLVNKLAPRMADKDESMALRDLIGKNKKTWRSKSTIWFEDNLHSDFRKLRDLFRKEKYDAKIAYDKESESWALYLGQDAKGVKEKAAPATSPFKEETKKKLDKFAELIPPSVEVKKPLPKPKAKPIKKPKRLTRKERNIMKTLDAVLEQSKEIHKSQYLTGRDYLEQFIADYAKLQKILEGKKKISEYTRHYVEVRLMAANVAFWTRYAEKRLAPPRVKATEEDAIREDELRGAISPGKKLMPSDPAMKWVKARYKRKTGISYDRNMEVYTALKDSHESAESLASQLRLAQQIADNTKASYKALAAIEKTFKKKFPKEAKAFNALLARVKKASETALNASKPTMENLHAWAGETPSAKAYLDSNSTAIEKMLETVYGAEFAKVLDYIDAAVKSELTGAKNPRPRPRIVLEKGADFRAVRDGLAILYAAKGLQKPLIKRTKAVRKSLKGKYILVDVSAPELFVKPNKKEILPPADKDGNIFIKYKGRKIWLEKGQKDTIEKGLREGGIAYIQVGKYGKKAIQVDAAGADLLVQYLREKGWTNLETTKWIGGRARAGVRTLEVSEGYWDRPVAKKVIKEVAPEKALAKKVGRRIDDEVYRTGIFEIEGPKDKRFGRVLDRTAERSKFEVTRQEEQLEALINSPGTGGTVYFDHVGVARNAAALLRAELLGRNDLRAVSVNVLHDYWGRVSGAYLTIGELSENAFSMRATTPLGVPSAYDGKAILANASDRAALQDFLNGKSKEGDVTFKAGIKGKEALASYLARIGYPADKVVYSQLLKPEVEALPKIERMLLEGEVWEITLSSVPMQVSAAEKVKSVAVLGLKGGGELQQKRERAHYGSEAYRLGLRTWYASSEAWLTDRLDKQARAEGKKAGFDVSHGLQVSSDVYKTHSQDYNRMSEDQRAYTILAAGGQGFSGKVMGTDKKRLYWQNNIARSHLTLYHMVETADGARFSGDVQAEVIKHMLYMHTGQGKMLKKDKIYYPERSAQMLAVLSKYKTIDEFADAINNNYAATAIYDAALQLTEEALALNLAYMAMPPVEQQKMKEATFDMMWRSYVSVVGFETGNRPSANPEQRQLDKCANALANYFAGRGKNNVFTAGGHKYKTLEAVVVRYNGKNVLAVPSIDEHGNIDPKWTYIVGERTHKTAPEGYVYWEVKLYDKKKMFKVRTRRAWSDSIGPAGLTYRYVWGTNPPELNIKKKPPKKEKEHVSPITMFFPEYYAPSGYVAVANDLYWKQVGVSFVVPKEQVLSRLPDGVLMFTTFSGEMEEGESKFFIHPPRTRFSPNGRELPVVEDYPTFRTYAYSSAYVDFNNGDAVYAFRKAGTKRMESPDFIPENARKYAGMSTKELGKKGIFRIRVGTFDRRSKTIEYKSKEIEEYFGKHTKGSWATNTKDLRKMTDEDKEEMGVVTESNRHYYVVESSHTAVPKKPSMEIGSHEQIGVTGSTKEDGLIYVSGNVPLVSGEWKKEKKKKR